MKTEFVAAITQLSAERNLPREVVLAVLESALASAYKRDVLADDVSVRINPDTGEVKAYLRKVVADLVTDPRQEISLAEARELQDEVQVGEVVVVEFTPKNAGRIAAQTAKQVISQRLREAEHQAIYEEFSGKEGEVITGVIQFVEPKQIYVGLGRAEALFPLSEQVHNERYRVGQRLKFYLLEITRGAKGPQIIVSRSHPNLLRRLFEVEIPEIHNGIVELKAVAREAGYRSKVAVSTSQEGIEPIGCCLGPRGIRIQNIVNELNGEKIDIIRWDASPEIFISNALKPAQVASIELDETGSTATVIVPDKQLSLAIGKEGQNARLAAKLTAWRIDIKSVSAAEAEKASLPEPIPEELESAAEGDKLPVAMVDEFQLPEPVGKDEALAKDEFRSILEASFEQPEEKAQIRFAEDILPSRVTTEAKAKVKRGQGKAKGHKRLISSSEGEEDEE